MSHGEKLCSKTVNGVQGFTFNLCPGSTYYEYPILDDGDLYSGGDPGTVSFMTTTAIFAVSAGTEILK